MLRTALQGEAQLQIVGKVFLTDAPLSVVKAFELIIAGIESGEVRGIADFELP